MPQKTYVSAIVSAALCIGMLTPAAAQDKPEAAPKTSEKQQQEAAEKEANVDERYKALTRQAAKAYGAKQYDKSLVLFQKAYALKPVPNLLYNMGRIEEKRGNFDAAIGHYEKFVTEPGVDIKARKDALERLKTLREVVALRKEGKKVDKEKLEEKHEDRELAVPKQTDKPKTRIERDYTAAWVTMGVALASYGASGFFALQARDANNDFENATTRSARREAANSGETASIVADSMLGVGVVMTGLSVYFFVSPSETEVPADQTAMRVAPQVGPEGAGMTFTVDF